MSILDDAIREHLELKRAHGADEAELKKLEDEAFGQAGSPDAGDSFSEAQTEFLATPATGAAEAAAEAKAGTAERSRPNITDLQEAPEAPAPSAEPAGEEAPAEAEAPAEGQAPSAEHQTVPVPRPESGPEAKVEDTTPEAPPEPSEPEDAAPETPTGPTTEERHAIADQPTELFDVEADIAPASEQPSPTDEQLLDSKLSEPRLAPSEPTDAIESTGPDAEVAGDPLTEDEDDFFSEQRLSDELNNALETPVTDEHEVLPQHEPFSEPEPPSEEHEAAPYTDEHEAVEDDYEDEEDDRDERERPSASSSDSDSEDVLEDTPDFLEDAPEDDELWFEQKPPKDFDFDD